MKNEVNRTFTVKKNKFTNFLSCFYANTPQNTGGGNSHSSTVVTPVWKGSRPTVSRRSTDSQSQDHLNHTPISKALKYAAMILMILTLGISQMWADPAYYYLFTPTNASVSPVHNGTKSGDFITDATAYSQSKTIRGLTFPSYAKTVGTATSMSGRTAGSQGIQYYVKTNSTKFIVYYGVSSSSSTYKVFMGKISEGEDAVTSVERIVHANDLDTLHFNCAFSTNTTVSFHINNNNIWIYQIVAEESGSTVFKQVGEAGYTLNFNKGRVAGNSSNEANVEGLYIKANSNFKYANTSKLVIAKNSVATQHLRFTAPSSPGKLKLTWSSGQMAYNTSASAEGATNIESGTEYELTAGNTYYLINTGGSGSDITKLEFISSEPAPEPSCTTPTIAWATGSTANISVYDALAATDLGIDVAEYTGNITWALSGDDIATLSNQSKTGCTVTGKSGQYGTATLTASFTLSGDATLCDGTYSVTKTITIKECVAEPAALTNEIARFQVPCDVDNTQVLTSPINRTECTCTFAGVGGNGNWYQNPTSKLWYGKMNGDGTSKYITITLTSGSFQAGDVVTIAINRDNTTKSGFKIKSTSGNTVEPASTASGVEATGTYTLTADDINNDGSLTFYRSNSSTYVNRIIITRPVSCAATVPGDISKGDLTAGEITLTAAGSAEEGDTWYWQNAENGEEKGTYGSGATKNVSTAATWYLRSYNTAGDCWSAAKSVEVTAADLLTAPTATFSDGVYVVGASALDLSTLWSSNSNGAVTYALKVASDDASVTTGAFSATKAGSYVVTASQAATSTYSAVEKEATITVTWPATGEATILYNVAVGTSNTALGTASTDDNSASISNLSNFTAVGLTVTGLGAGKDGLSTKLQTLSAKDVSKYIYVTFDVASGKEFVLDSVVTYIVAVSNAKTIEVVMNDTEGTKDSLNYSQAKNSEAAKHVFDFTSSAKAYEGTVTLKLYAYGETDHYRLGQPLKICGTVATKVVKYDLSFAAGTGASGSMSTLKYAEGAEVTLPACTFTAPTGKEFDAWVVTETLSGDAVTVTDGAFTMPAVAVTATATWKDRPKHTDATLSDLTVAGETVDDFDAATTSYNVELPFGTTSAPTVAATATDASYVKSVAVTQAASASGDATVVVTAEDGTTTKTYTIHFSVEETKDIELVWATDKQRCDETTPDAKVLIDAMSQYLSASYTGSAKEEGSLNTGKTTGSKIIITAKPGYAFKTMGFYGKIEDGSCNFYKDGVVETIGTSTGDACYANVFSNEEVHEFVIELSGSKGVWIRNMQLTMIQACTPKTIVWTAEPAAEYELGASVDPIAASANNGTVTYASDDADVIAVNSSNGALTLKTLGSVTLSASVSAGDGVTYCDEGAQVSKANMKTYYLVTFDAQNETTPTPVKYYSGDDAIALPEDPTYSGFNFLGWFDADEGGNEVTSAITPTASRTVYAQWEAKCTGPTITTQPVSANYFVGRTASALSCEATPGVDGKALTYTWYSCDDAERTNPVELAGAPTPSTAAIGTFYYYCAVTEADCDVVRNSNVATITVTEKDKVCLVKADLQAGDKNASISAKTGSYKDDANIAINIAKNLKLGETGNYVKLGVTGTSFANGDEVVITLVDGSTLPAWLQLFAGTGSDLLAERKSGVTAGANTLTISNVPANQKVLYLYRTSASGTNMNPFVQSMAVYRACPAPVLEGISLNGTAAEADEVADNTFNVELTNGTNLASMEVVHNVMWVGAHATTPYIIMTNEGEWAWGTNTYRVMDKDGDYTDYTINLTEALPDAETPVIATDLTDHAYCAGEIPELDATANAVSDGGTLSYQWYNADGIIEDAISATYTPAGEGSYYCKVTNTLAEHRPMTTTSATAVLTQKAATSISGDAAFEIEQGATVKFQPTITGSDPSYAWYACDAEGNHEGDALGTKASYTTAALNDLGTFYYVLEVTAECGNASQVFAVTVSDLGGSLVAHRPGNYYGQTLKEYDGRYYEIYGMSRISSDNYLWAGTPISAITDENCVMNLETTTEISWMKNTLNGQGSQYSALSSKAQFTNPSLSSTYSMKYNQTSNMLVLKVKGYDQFSMVSKDANTSNKYLQVFIDGEERERTSKSTSEAVYDFDLTDGEHLIVVRPSTSDNNYIFQFSLRLPVVAKVDETNIVSVQDAIDAASDPITITMVGNSYEDIVIENGKDVTIAGGGHTLNSITVEKGGKVNTSSALTLVDNLYLEAQAGASGQVLGATNVTANAVYMDVTFFKGATELDETTAGRWYMISAPFDVNLADGFYKTDGTPMVFGQTDGKNIFDLFEYDGNKRATTGVTGWKRVQGKMKAGRACLIGFNPEQPTTIRLKAASTVLSEPTSITLNAYDGDNANRNWNGVANPTLHYTDLSCDVQTYNNEDGENGRKYITYSASSTSFVVGTAFFVQATGSIDLTAASHSEFRAPQRQANERYEACVRIFRDEATEFADQMYVRASENASNEYEQGHDMITWNGTTANTALIWAENYGKRLAIEEAPLVNDKATYNLGIFAPIAGEYRIEAANPSEDATLYLTKNGRIFWNLTMGACELDLAQGQNNEYGLVLRAEAPAVTTGIDEVRSEAGVQKLIIDENVFILRGEQLFDMTGKAVK